MADKVRKRVVVHGHVQGVFFRDSLRRLAERHAVAGWARNVPDGTLEAALEGGPEAVERIVEFCRLGPRGAAIERVDVFEEEPEDLSSFSVR